MAHVLAPRLPHTRFVLPNAPMRPISVNNNMEMPGWYDIADVGAARALAAEDREGIEESAAALSALLADEVRQLSQRSKSTSTSTSEAASSGNTADADTDAEASRRVAIGGFSQGGAMALRVGLAWNSPLAALVTASAYVVQRDALLSGEINSTANAATPILVCSVLKCLMHYCPTTVLILSLVCRVCCYCFNRPFTVPTIRWCRWLMPKKLTMRSVIE